MSEPRILFIYIFPEEGGPAVELDEARAVVGKGLDGDHKRSRKRQVTLLSIEAWRAATSELGTELPPKTRRANVVLEGIDLSTTIGKRIRVGQALLEIHGETAPCTLMDQAKEGLKDALAPNLRGGVFASVVEEGTLRVSDPARLVR